MRSLMLKLLFLFCLLPSSAQAVSAGAAGLLSIVPGLGQTIEGNPLEGLAWFTTVIGSSVLGDSVHIYAPIAGKQTAILNQAAYDLWLYNMYDAYRDGHPSGGFSDHSAFSNYAATFNPLNLVDPITTPVLAIGTYGFGIPGGNTKRITLTKPVFFAFVGMGEEGLFRGFLFPALSQTFNSKIIGATSSSLLFSLFHITNGVADMEHNFLQRFVMGVVFCWAVDRNKYDLRHGIFAHSWIDVINEAGASRGESVTQVKFHIPFG